MTTFIVYFFPFRSGRLHVSAQALVNVIFPWADCWPVGCCDVDCAGWVICVFIGSGSVKVPGVSMVVSVVDGDGVCSDWLAGDID